MIFNQIFLVLIIQIVLYYNVQFVISCNIRNGNMPACKNCKHYKLDFSILPNYQFGRCKIYGNKDLITNKISYTYATTVRKNDDMCGLEGKDYDEVTNILLNEIISNIKDNFYFTIIFLSVIMKIAEKN